MCGSMQNCICMKRRSFPDKPFFSWMGWGMLKACPRRWFLYNFGRDLPGDQGRDYLIERKLSYWQAFSGQLADDGVTEAIRHFKKFGVWRQDMDAFLHERALEYIKESREYTKAAREGGELPRGKRQILDRYFFDEVPPDKAEHLKVLELAREAVRNFYGTDLPGRIESVPRESLMCDHKDGDFPWAEHNGVPVYAMYDFAIKLPDHVTIFDWKTGKITPEKESAAIEQLHWYAQYAVEVWGMNADQVSIAPVFLSVNAGYEEVPVNAEKLGEIKQRWKHKHAEIKSFMQASKDLEQLQDSFPMTDSLRECNGCVFRSCPGYLRVLQGRELNAVKFAIRDEIE